MIAKLKTVHWTVVLKMQIMWTKINHGIRTAWYPWQMLEDSQATKLTRSNLPHGKWIVTLLLTCIILCMIRASRIHWPNAQGHWFSDLGHQITNLVKCTKWPINFHIYCFMASKSWKNATNSNHDLLHLCITYVISKQFYVRQVWMQFPTCLGQVNYF